MRQTIFTLAVGLASAAVGCGAGETGGASKRGNPHNVDASVPDSSALDAYVDPNGPTGLLVFASLTDHHIYTIGVDGSARTKLTTTQVNERPAWSPDGQKIAFVRRISSNPDIYVMNADGSNVVRRTVGAGYASVAWSPDGQQLAVSTEGLYSSDIWVINATDDGSPAVHVAADARTPAWSPDGQKIAYIHISGDDGYDALATMNPDGSGKTDITAAAGGRYGLTWAPSGSRLASSVCVAAVCDLFAMNPDGSNVVQLTSVGNAHWGASWSPDGQWIAVGLWGTGPSLAYVPASGGALQAIADDGMTPSWHP